MPTTNRPNPDIILAHVRVLRLTDRLLDAAEELREARDELQMLLSSDPMDVRRSATNTKREGRREG